MNPLRDLTQNEVRGELLRAGMTLPAFAEDIGVSAGAVRSAIRRYAKQDKYPNGPVTRRVLEALAPYVDGQKPRENGGCA